MKAAFLYLLVLAPVIVVSFLLKTAACEGAIRWLLCMLTR